MRKGWELKKLSEVSVIGPPKKEAREKLNDNDLVSFLPMEDLGIVSKVINPLKEKSLKEVSGSYTYFADNDVLLAKITPCFENGKIGIVNHLKNGIGFGSSEYLVFRTKEYVSSEWLFYFLSRSTFREEGRKLMTGAVGHKRVSKDWLENYPIPIPPLPEQNSIVAILDEAFEAIDQAKANTAKNLQNAKELFQSELNSIFTNKGERWVEKSILNVCKEIFAGGDAPKEIFSAVKTETCNIPIYANAVKDKGLYGFTNEARVFEPSITISARGSGTGHTELRNDSFLPIVRLIVLIPDLSQISLEFLKYSVDNLNILRSGSAIPQLTVPMIKEYKMPLPPLPVQHNIVNQLNTLSVETKHLEENYRKKQESLEELKKSILQKAFSGELTCKIIDYELSR